MLFTTFLGLAATGLPLRFSESIWARRLASEVGGFGAILFFHKFCAIVLTLAFLFHVKDIFTRGLMNREKGIFWGATSMVANWKDVKDMFAHFRWFLGLGPKPKFERYAYWEKFDYWAVFWGMIVIGFSGYAMWFAPFFAHFLPGWALNAVLVIHSEEGLLAILFIFSIHFVNTHLRPGKLSHGHGDLHRRGERRGVQAQADGGVRAPGRGRQAGSAPWRKARYWLVNFGRVVGTIAIVIGLVLLVLTLTAYFGE